MLKIGGIMFAVMILTLSMAGAVAAQGACY